MTGNTIVDAVLQNIKLAEEYAGSPYQNTSSSHCTEENVDKPEKLRKIIRGLELVANTLKSNNFSNTSKAKEKN